MTGIVFVLRSGNPRQMFPQELGCGSGMTCWRRLRDWQRAGVWDRMHFALLDWLARSEWTLTYGHSKGVLVIFFLMSKGRGAARKKSEVLQGTLDLMILKTLQGMGPLHGFGIARRLEQLSEEVLRLNEGTVYTSLLRLQQEGWIVAEWGASENNRKAKFYSITKSGLKQLAKETEDWERISAVIGRVLRLASEKP